MVLLDFLSFFFEHLEITFPVTLLIIIAVCLLRVRITDRQMEKEHGKDGWKKIQQDFKDGKFEQEEIEQERRIAFESHKSGAAWDAVYATDPCPHCGHYKVRTAKWDDKKISVAFWGVASDKIGKAYICDHCKKMW